MHSDLTSLYCSSAHSQRATKAPAAVGCVKDRTDQIHCHHSAEAMSSIWCACSWLKSSFWLLLLIPHSGVLGPGKACILKSWVFLSDPCEDPLWLSQVSVHLWASALSLTPDSPLQAMALVPCLYLASHPCWQLLPFTMAPQGPHGLQTPMRGPA